MADISGYTHKWRATSNNNQSDTNKVNKRNRQPTSCQACRIRKLKCDKGHPCEACTKRGEEESCNYGKAITTQPPRRPEPKAANKAQERLRQLEDLVRQLVKPTDEEQQPSPASSKGMDCPEGPLHRDRHGVSYTGSTHWSAVLDQIQDLRSSLSSDLSSPGESVNNEADINLRSGAIFGVAQPPPLPTILQRYLPPRKQVDRYLSTYFNAKFMVIPFLHTGQFQRQYEQFWQNQSSAPPMWVSILFSIICFSNIIRKATGGDTESSSSENPTGDQYLAASAQCLVLGDYTKPQPHLLEALAIHIQCKYTLSLDPNREIGLILSILARQAYTMGYHRDPSKFPGQFTPFEGEQRRRCWSAFKQFDVMTSFQLGIPPNFLPEFSDTLQPRNLLDSDFDEDTTVLPSSRPETEPTPMLYFCTKGKLMDVYNKIVRHILSFPSEPPTNAEIMALHAEIIQARDSVPAVLRTRPISSSYSDPAYLIMLRTNLMFIGEKALCVLHRKYMGTSTPQANFSRRICLEACTRLVSYFIDLHAELAPGGQLYQDRWMMTSFTINDFLLTTMLLCITIWQSQKNFVSKDSQNLLEQDVEAKAHFDLLVKAQGICAEYGRRSVEMKHVAEVVSHVLGKIRSADSSRTPNIVNGKFSRDITKQYHLHEKGGMNSNLPSTDDSTTEIPLDLTPLSMNNDSTDSGSVLGSRTIPSPPTSTITSSDDMSATWTFNSAPAIKPTSTEEPFYFLMPTIIPKSNNPAFSPRPRNYNNTTNNANENDNTNTTNDASVSISNINTNPNFNSHSHSNSSTNLNIPTSSPLTSLLLSEINPNSNSSTTAELGSAIDWTNFDSFLNSGSGAVFENYFDMNFNEGMDEDIRMDVNVNMNANMNELGMGTRVNDGQGAGYQFGS